MAAPKRTLSPVGMSAAEYAATHDIAERCGLFEELLAIDPSVAIDLATERDWWYTLEQSLSDQSLPKEVAHRAVHILGGKAPTFPKLYDSIVSSIPSHIAFLFSQGIFDEFKREAWQALRSRFDRLQYDDALGLIRSLVCANVISSQEAVLLFDSVPAPKRDRSSFDYDYSLYALLPVILERLGTRDAKAFFRKTVNMLAIADSTAGFNSERAPTVLGADPSILQSAKIVCDKLPNSLAIAWANRMLIESHISDDARFSHKYDGRELAGPGHSQKGNHYSYQDNAWLLRIIVPLLKAQFDEMSREQLKRRLNALPHSISALHSTFRVRAFVLAFPATYIGTVADDLISLCKIEGSIPSIADAVAARAIENATLARAYLEWVWKKRHILSQPDEAKLLHALITSDEHGPFARSLAKEIVASELFSTVEPLQLGFFSQMDWVARDRRFALELIVHALRSGYSPSLWDSGYIVNLLKDIFSDTKLKQEAMKMTDLKPYLPEAISSEDFLDAATAKTIFIGADRSSKISLLQKAGEWPAESADTLIRLGLQDPDPTPDSEVEQNFRDSDTSSIAGVRVTAYWALIRQLQAGRISLSQVLGLNALESVSGECGRYGAHHGLILLQAIMNVALREQDFEIGTAAVDIALGFLRLDDERIDEQVANLIIWWSPKLSESYREILRLRLGKTESFLNVLMGKALFNNDDLAAAELDNALKDASSERLSWSAWNLWRSLHIEGAPKLESRIVQRLVDRLRMKPLSEAYSSLTRLLAEHQAEDQAFATTRFLKILETSAKADLIFPVPLDLELYLGSAKEELVEFLELLCSLETYKFGPYVNIALSLLLQMNDASFNSRAQKAIQRIPSSLDYDGKRQRWRRLISS